MMERDSYNSLHGIHHHQYPLSLYNSQYFMEPFISKGLLKAPPPLSLLHSAPPPAPPQPPLLPLPSSLPRRSYSCPAMKNGTRKHRSSTNGGLTSKKSTKTSTKNYNNNNIPKKEEKKTPKTSSNTVRDDRDMLPGSAVFAISPPPSSLPLPSFCLRPKLSCNAVAAGAADDLRRLLRLQ